MLATKSLHPKEGTQGESQGDGNDETHDGRHGRNASDDGEVNANGPADGRCRH